MPDLDTLVAHPAAGFADRGVSDGTPDGPAHVLHDLDGSELGSCSRTFPTRWLPAHADPTNHAAVPRGS